MYNAVLEGQDITKNIPRIRHRADKAHYLLWLVERQGSVSVLVSALQLAMFLLDVSLLSQRVERRGS